jgi:hypothetical protein
MITQIIITLIILLIVYKTSKSIVNILNQGGSFKDIIIHILMCIGNWAFVLFVLAMFFITISVPLAIIFILLGICLICF